MADNAKSNLDQMQPSVDEPLEQSTDQDKKYSTRPFVRYTRAQLLYLSKSPLVTVPNGMPHFKDWFGEWGDASIATTKKEPASEALGQLPRDRARFRRDNEDGEGSREAPSSGRPTFKNALSFSQASGSAMGSMGSFRHPSSRLESDARREEREREREREGRRETENLRNLSQQFDRERRDREAAPHLHRIVSGASSTNGRDPKSRDPARDNAKEPSREARRGRGDDAHDWRKARDDDRQRSRSRPRGKGEREPGGGSKREKDNWTSPEERRGAAGRRRNAAGDDRVEGKAKDERAATKNDRDKLLQEEEPAWMGDYVPEAGSRGILGLAKGEDDIQAWKREQKEKDRTAQGIEADSPDDEGLGGLDDAVTHMKLIEEKAKKTAFGQSEDDGLDEIQRFKKLMQESERQRREEAERKALELAGKSEPKATAEQTQPTNGVADAPVTVPPPGPPGLTKSVTDIDLASTPPVPDVSDTNGRIGGISLGSSNWPISAATTPSTTAATLSTPGWTQSGGSSTDSASNSRLSPIQARRFTQDGTPADGAVVGTRSTSRFANFFGDKHREPSAPQFNSNVPVPTPPHPQFMQGGNDSQLLETLLARLTESQARQQVQPPQTQDRAFAQRNPSMPSQPQYSGVQPQNIMNLQHAQPTVVQHQRAQLSIHQQQQQLLSSLNAGSMSNNAAGIHSLGHAGPSSHPQAMNSGLLNPSLNLDIDGRFVSDNLVPGLRPRNGSVAFDEDFQVNPAAAGMGRGTMQQHRPQQSFDALHRQQQQPGVYNMGGNRTPTGGFRNGPSPIGGHNPNPMQRAPDLPQYLGGMPNALTGGPVGTGGNSNGPQQQYGNRLGAMGNLGNMLGAGGPPNQPRFDERQRIQQGQAIHHQSGQSLSGIGGLPLDFGLLHQQQPQRQMPRNGIPGVGGYPMQQNPSQMGPRSGSGLHGGMGAQYPGHMHNDFVVQPNQTTNASDIMAMFLANQGNAGMGA